MTWNYLPDAPPETPNIWTVCDGFHPSKTGVYRTGWTVAALSAVSAVGAGIDFQGGFAYKVVAGTAQILLLHTAVTAGVAQKAYVYNGAWNDRTGTLPAIFANGTQALQVGNITLIAAVSAIYQRDASGTGNFAVVASSPAAGALAVNALNITVALDTNSDAWANSDIASPTVWTGGESSSGNLRHTPGNNTAIVALGTDFIAFKDRGVYRGFYVGGSTKMEWHLVDANKGAWGVFSAIEADGKIYFIGRAGFYSFDGANFERLDSGIWTSLLTLFGTTGGPVLYNFALTKLVYDSITSTIVLQQQASANGGLLLANGGAFYTFNTVSKAWGFQSIQYDPGKGVSDSITGIFNAAVFNGYTTTGNPSYSTDVAYISSSSANDRVEMLTTPFSSSTVGSSIVPKLRTYRVGKRDRMTVVTRAIPNWTKADGAGTDLSTAVLKTATPYISDAPITTESSQGAVTLSTNLYRADYTKAARFQSVEIQVDTNSAIDGVTFITEDAGQE